MRVLGIDLAASATAVVGVSGLDPDGRIIYDRARPAALGASYVKHRWDEPGEQATMYAHRAWAERVAALTRSYDLVLIEDLPGRLPQNGNTRTVLLLQGVIGAVFSGHPGLLEKTLLIHPGAWQRPMGVSAKGDKDLAVQRAVGLGLDLDHYVPMPEKVRGSGPDRARARKMQSDVADAFLMACQGQVWLEKYGTASEMALQLTRCAPYNH